MLDTILKFDTDLFLFLNHLNSDFFDSIMLGLSYNMVPGIIIIILFLTLGYKKYGKRVIIPFLFLLTTFGLSDTISSKVFKDGFKRLRPMHQPTIMNEVYTAKLGRGGGKYGFVSSHASNTFALCFFIFLFLRKRYPIFKYLFIYATLVSYSRIYLGKHYPLDIICGAMLGLIIAFTMFKAFSFVELNYLKPSQDQPQ